MAYATVTIPGDGSTTLITASFAIGVINDADVKIRVTGEVDGGGNPVYRTYTKVGTDQYQVDGTAAPVGQFYVAERRVSKTGLIVDWEDGDAITEENLNTSQKQTLMVAHEALDQANFAYKTIDNSQGGTITPGEPGRTLIYDDFGNLVPGFTGDEIANANDYAIAAGNSATASANSASASSGYATQSMGYRDTAQQWATNPEDVVVTAGQYSAFHWAQKAYQQFLAVVAGIANAIHTAPANATFQDADEIGIVDSTASWSLKRLNFLALRKQLGADYLKGLITTRTSTTRVTVGTGEIRMNGRYVTNLANLAKDINATWVAGNNVGGMEPTKTVAANTTYHLHALVNTTTLAFEWMYSPDVAPANIPAGYARVGRFWSVYTNGSSQVITYEQVDNSCVMSATAWFSTSTNVALTLSTPPTNCPVPAGISTKAHVYVDTTVNGSSAMNCLVWDAASLTSTGRNVIRIFAGIGGTTSSDQQSDAGLVRTNTVRQMGVQAAFTGSAGVANLSIGGWEDYTLPRVY